MVPKKGVDVLISAMAIVLENVPGARLVIAGDGPERLRLESQANDLGISGSVQFAGHLDATGVENALATAWVQAVPSVWEEPFGLVAAESMMRGTAVVASRSGGLTEQVVEGETGYLVPPGDAGALAHAIGRVLVDRKHAENLGRLGRQIALANFTHSRHVDGVLGIFEKVLRKESS
jgi:glycosyltransferase involved in cell wall biosynthesis